jgi:hypothetical protein
MVFHLDRTRPQPYQVALRKPRSLENLAIGPGRLQTGACFRGESKTLESGCSTPRVTQTEDDDHSGGGRRQQEEAADPGALVQMLEEARERHRAGRLREALRLYRRIASNRPDCVDALF